MKCAQCGADNRSGAKFCEQCGTQIENALVAAALPVSVSPQPAHDSLMDNVVESMAKEPGTSKGPGFKLALAFLFLLLIAGLLWAYMGQSSSSQQNPTSSSSSVGDAQEHAPLKAPSLAEQMGTSVTPVESNPTDTKAEPANTKAKASADSQRGKDVKNKARREEEQRKKNEEARLVQEEKDNAARKAALASRGLSTAQEVANCEKMSVFARQPCLWRACNGKWGKDGCPSYD